MGQDGRWTHDESFEQDGQGSLMEITKGGDGEFELSASVWRVVRFRRSPSVVKVRAPRLGYEYCSRPIIGRVVPEEWMNPYIGKNMGGESSTLSTETRLEQGDGVVREIRWWTHEQNQSDRRWSYTSYSSQRWARYKMIKPFFC